MAEFEHFLHGRSGSKYKLFLGGFHLSSEHPHNAKGPGCNLQLHILGHQYQFAPDFGFKFIQKGLSDKDAV